MKDIAIYGAGGLGREVACVINSINNHEHLWNLIGFFDDGIDIGSSNDYGKVLGGIETLNKYNKSLNLVIAVGDPIKVKNIVDKIHNPLVFFPNIISPDTTFADRNNFDIGKGNVLLLGDKISCNVSIGNFNIFDDNVVIGHDVTIGSYNSFMPSVNISGEVVIGNRNFFGVQAVILQQIRVGDGIRLGANSVLIKKALNSGLYIGNPAELFNY